MAEVEGELQEGVREQLGMDNDNKEEEEEETKDQSSSSSKSTVVVLQQKEQQIATRAKAKESKEKAATVSWRRKCRKKTRRLKRERKFCFP